MICGFCGTSFVLSDAEAVCHNCPLAGACNLIRCPQCGYEMPPEAKLISRLKTLGRRLAPNGHAAMEERVWQGVTTLDKLWPGQTGEIQNLLSDDHKTVQKLVAMNLLPGELICVLRKTPSVVFQVGYSQFAVDEEIAGMVEVKVES